MAGHQPGNMESCIANFVCISQLSKAQCILTAPSLCRSMPTFLPSNDIARCCAEVREHAEPRLGLDTDDELARAVGMTSNVTITHIHIGNTPKSMKQ
jgi:hypothetical protein